jgi:hypothetical protein
MKKNGMVVNSIATGRNRGGNSKGNSMIDVMAVRSHDNGQAKGREAQRRRPWAHQKGRDPTKEPSFSGSRAEWEPSRVGAGFGRFRA